MLINYLGPAKTFPHYSITDIIKGVYPGTFKNKIVIVGATAVGIYDLRVTPFSAVYPGVEIHATIIDNILHQNFLYRPRVDKISRCMRHRILGSAHWHNRSPRKSGSGNAADPGHPHGLVIVNAGISFHATISGLI